MMLKRYTLRQGSTAEHIVTECEELMSPTTLRRLADSLWADGFLAEGDYYDGLARTGKCVWELVWTEQHYYHAIPRPTVTKLMRRGQWEWPPYPKHPRERVIFYACDVDCPGVRAF